MCCDWPPKHILNYQNECNLLFVNEECDVTSLSTQKYREKMHNLDIQSLSWLIVAYYATREPA